jgi:hypothetical protein
MKSAASVTSRLALLGDVFFIHIIQGQGLMPPPLRGKNNKALIFFGPQSA